MKDKLNRFMQGRYGVDNFARFTLGVALFVIVVGSFMRQNAAGGVLDTVGFILIIYTYFRILSRNISARYAENQKYLGYTQKIRSRFTREKNMMEQRKTQSRFVRPKIRPYKTNNYYAILMKGGATYDSVLEKDR